MLLGTTRPLPALLAFPPSCLCGLDLLSGLSLERNENLDLAPTRALSGTPSVIAKAELGQGSAARVHGFCLGASASGPEGVNRGSWTWASVPAGQERARPA